MNQKNEKLSTASLLYIGEDHPAIKYSLLAVFLLSCLFFIFFVSEVNREIAADTNANPKIETPLESKVQKITEGHPLEYMAPYIAQRPKKVAYFLVAIAKKESDWGNVAPEKDGLDCFNYWGYRGKENTTHSGYSCFDNREQAIEVVGDRIERLIKQDLDTPREMVVWKCGSDCSWDNPAAVEDWINDVAYYLEKLEKG
ncbi:MAG: hypothetical protein NTZ97_01355 [Candidatus Moranbacteria bacterium]|nr:hypothetical protein [Candidatus Moranbacteria bacterium]